MASSISTEKNVKATLEAMSPQQFDALKQVATYYRMVRVLRGTGRINLFLGALTLWLGLSVPGSFHNTFSDIQTVAGVLIIAQSLWAISHPSVKGVLALAIILLGCGTWNLFITVYGRFNGIELWVGLLGLYQVWAAYHMAQFYLRLSPNPPQPPAPELKKQYDDFWAGTIKPSPTLAPELMKVQFARNRHWWTALLVPDRAILAHARTKELLIVNASEMTIVAENPKTVSRESFIIFAQIAEDFLIGRIYRNGFQQYLDWKGLINGEAGLTPQMTRKRIIRKITRWIMIGILVIIVLYVVMMLSVVAKYS